MVLNIQRPIPAAPAVVTGEPSMTARSHPLRILHVFRAPVGGLFRHVLDVARGQSERGHAVGVLCDESTGGARAEELLAALSPHLALGVTRLPMRRDPHPRDLPALLAARRIARTLRADVLHGHGAKGGLYARLALSRRGEAISAYTPHGGSFNYAPGTTRHALYMSAERFMARRTDVFLFESDYIAGCFRAGVGETERVVRIVYNGLAPAEFEPVRAAAEPFDLMQIGELRPGKGVDTLIDALALLRHERGARLTLLVVGSGPSERELKARAEAAGVADAITFMPQQPIRQVLGRARLMVMPSHAESLPYVILEAAAAAQPLLATRVGGIPEIFGPQGDVLIAPADAALLAAAIRRTLAEPDETTLTKAEALQRFVRGQFSLAAMVDGVLAGYAEARARRAAARDRAAAA
ncbi:MAG TPA: glycosyltransferase family 4 protein [Beijerinckiaceae bacterium]|nr:glycosyltransferase family 4 protein [Beijerinckiaceae bacterium]